MTGFIFSAVLGTILHFLFDWTGGNGAAALFSAVNESVWEHMKLLFYPMLLYAILSYGRWGREETTFWWVSLAGTMLGLILIPTLYYTYTGALGMEADWFNITIFFLAAGASYYLQAWLLQKGNACPLSPKVAVGILAGIALLFTIFTFYPPQIPLFRDPLTGSYGFRWG